jgi:hypothetical protein
MEKASNRRMDPGTIDKTILRQMKYLSDQRGIMNRYLAEGDNWEPHLENTRNFIIRCLQEDRPETVAVLGSGWLIDLPVDDLIRSCRTVFLVDVFHPPQVLHKIQKIKNFRAIKADVTGGAILGVYHFVRDHRRSQAGGVLDIPFQASLPGIRPDYIISLNILNQLDILLLDYLKKHLKIPQSEELEFRRRIQSQHVSLLIPGRSCLVADTEERVISRKKGLISSKNLIHCELPGGRMNEEWIWKFDSRGEYNPGNQTEMVVKAIQF